jgi:hypothetical protein
MMHIHLEDAETDGGPLRFEKNVSGKFSLRDLAFCCGPAKELSDTLSQEPLVLDDTRTATPACFIGYRVDTLTDTN